MAGEVGRREMETLVGVALARAVQPAAQPARLAVPRQSCASLLPHTSVARALAQPSCGGTRTLGPLLRPVFQRTVRRVTVEIPSGGQIEARLILDNDPSVPLSLKLGKSGHVIYALPAMLKMGFRIVECTPGELAIMESHGITLTGTPPLVRWSAG
jgi:hypothetical protein